jgi:hypothetical protein
MINLSTVSSADTSQIGALELDEHLESRDDSVLEIAAGTAIPGPPYPHIAHSPLLIRADLNADGARIRLRAERRSTPDGSGGVKRRGPAGSSRKSKNDQARGL